MNKRQITKLRKIETTTRGTTRQRAPKGLARDVRLQILKAEPLEKLEALFVLKLGNMSPGHRLQIEEELEQLTGDARREFLLKVLSQ